MTQKLSNNATAELMQDMGSRVLPTSTLPHDKDHQGGGSAPGHSTVRSPTSVATTVTIELRPSAPQLSSTTVMYQRPVKVLTPWEQLLKAHYRSTFHRPGIDYNHFRRGIPTGREWLCVGKNLPPKSYNQRQKSLKQLLSSSAQKWNSDAGRTMLWLSRDGNGKHLGYNTYPITVPLRWVAISFNLEHYPTRDL